MSSNDMILKVEYDFDLFMTLILITILKHNSQKLASKYNTLIRILIIK